MPVQLYESQYKNQRSVVLANETLRAEFVAPGGRMVSLRHKRRDYDIFLHQQGTKYIRGEYGLPMSSEQPAGFDDMFPTIIECDYEHFPWKGVGLPDHGEAWALDWNVARESEVLTLFYYGVRLPYKFTRRVSLVGGNQLRMDYTLENLSPFEILYLWSAHPMLRAEKGARFVLPEECREATTVLSLSGRLGSYGDHFTWPHWTDSKGKSHDLSLIDGGDVYDLEKYFFKNRVLSGWCGLRYPNGLTLRLSFPPESVPFLAIVLGKGTPADPKPHALLEPCSAPFDRLDVSRFYTDGSKIAPKGANRWFLTFSVDA